MKRLIKNLASKFSFRIFIQKEKNNKQYCLFQDHWF